MRLPVFLTLPVLALAAAGPAAAAGCTSRTAMEPRGEVRFVECPVVAADAPHGYRFEAFFTGGHDDTVAELVTTLDEAPLTCEPGSKTRLEGEFGDVSVACRFRVDAAQPAPQVARIKIVWTHAQFDRFEFAPLVP